MTPTFTAPQFAKGHGTENDFVILPDPDGELDLRPSLVRAICDRKAGLGADGVLRVVRSAVLPEAAEYAERATWFMDYRNADGSIAEMCGNGVRVFVRYLAEAGLVTDGPVTVASRGGLKEVRLHDDGTLTVDMGPAIPRGESIAVVAGQRLVGTRVSMGNPHLVCVLDDAKPGDLEAIDLTVQPGYDPAAFPDGVNVELVVPADGAAPAGYDAQVSMRVHERGVGETRSCGTGACAVGYAVLAARAEPGAAVAGRVAVDVPGGRLVVTVDETSTLLTGPAVIVAAGQLDPTWLAAVG